MATTSSSKRAPKKTAPKKTAPKKTAPKKAAPKAAPKKAAPKKAAPKAAPKKAAPKKAAPKKAAPVASKSATRAALTSVARRVAQVAVRAAAAVKSAARKVVPKRSASYGMSIEAFTAKLPTWQQQVVGELAALVKANAPDATGMIKWGQPVFDHHGPFAFIKPAKAHVTLGFWRGAELNDEQGILGGAGDRMKHLKIAKGDAIPLSLLERLIAEAVRLNETKGDPTMARKPRARG